MAVWGLSAESFSLLGCGALFVPRRMPCWTPVTAVACFSQSASLWTAMRDSMPARRSVTEVRQQRPLGGGVIYCREVTGDSEMPWLYYGCWVYPLATKVAFELCYASLAFSHYTFVIYLFCCLFLLSLLLSPLLSTQSWRFTAAYCQTVCTLQVI